MGFEEWMRCSKCGWIFSVGRASGKGNVRAYNAITCPNCRSLQAEPHWFTGGTNQPETIRIQHFPGHATTWFVHFEELKKALETVKSEDDYRRVEDDPQFSWARHIFAAVRKFFDGKSASILKQIVIGVLVSGINDCIQNKDRDHFNIEVNTLFKIYVEQIQQKEDAYRAVKKDDHKTIYWPDFKKSGSKEPGRNDPCPCGSGKKFKKCHGMIG